MLFYLRKTLNMTKIEHCVKSYSNKWNNLLDWYLRKKCVCKKYSNFFFAQKVLKRSRIFLKKYLLNILIFFFWFILTIRPKMFFETWWIGSCKHQKFIILKMQFINPKNGIFSHNLKNKFIWDLQILRHSVWMWRTSNEW